MKIKELETLFGLCPVQDTYEDREILAGYTSDLLSDVMGNAPERSVLITIQAHKNTVAVATLVGILAIIICNGREIPQDMISAAQEERIAIFHTPENQFTISGRLYCHLTQ